jgi:hypothetical protein
MSADDTWRTWLDELLIWVQIHSAPMSAKEILEWICANPPPIALPSRAFRREV